MANPKGHEVLCENSNTQNNLETYYGSKQNRQQWRTVGNLITGAVSAVSSPQVRKHGFKKVSLSGK